MTENATRLNSRRWIWIVGGVIVFGVLMGVREEFESIWLRALIAACAGAILGISLLTSSINRSLSRGST